MADCDTNLHCGTFTVCHLAASCYIAARQEAVRLQAKYKPLWRWAAVSRDRRHLPVFCITSGRRRQLDYGAGGIAAIFPSAQRVCRVMIPDLAGSAAALVLCERFLITRVNGGEEEER